MEPRIVPIDQMNAATNDLRNDEREVPQQQQQKQEKKSKDKTSVEKVWMTFLLKEWKDHNQMAATVLIGCNGGVKECTHRMNKAHIDDGALIARYTEPHLARFTYNATLEFRSELVYDLYPFQVYRLLCEWEVQGSVKNDGFHKYSLAIPRMCKEKAYLSLTNFVSMKKEVFKNIVHGSQDVFVDAETAKNKEQYYPRVFIRFLKMSDTSRKIFLFYFPFSVLWLLAILSSVTGNELTRSDFINVIIGLVLTIAVGSSSMIDDKNYKELVLFNFGVLLFVAMAIPGFSYAVYLPGVMWLWLPVSYIIYRQWLAAYTTGGRRFRTIETKETKHLSKKLTHSVEEQHLYAVPASEDDAVICDGEKAADEPRVVVNVGTKEDCLCTSQDEAFDLGLQIANCLARLFGKHFMRCLCLDSEG